MASQRADWCHDVATVAVAPEARDEVVASSGHVAGVGQVTLVQVVTAGAVTSQTLGADSTPAGGGTYGGYLEEETYKDENEIENM